MANTISNIKQSPNQQITHPARRMVPTFFTDLFDELGAPSLFVKPMFSELLDTSFKVDIKESPKAFDISAQIPGMKKEDIHISIDGGMVTIQAERKQSTETKSADERVIRNECYYGSSVRSFQMPAEIDRNQVKASYENGVLFLTLPKKNGGQSHEIKIN